jgi:hypothetical protein
MSINQDLTIESVRLGPPAAVAGLSLWGVSLQDWVLVITLVYTIFSLFFLLRDKLYRPWKERRNGGKH